jgi:hypothetical protein
VAHGQLALRQQDKSINAFEKSIEINPKNPNPYLYISVIYLEKKW